MAEAGTLAPQDHPLIGYYRGYCRERAGGSGQADYRAAAALSTRYVFPSRASTFPVLKAALAADPSDATAHFLLGSLLLSGGRSDEAIAEWQQTRGLNPRLPVLHRNLGLTLLHARNDAKGALEMFLEGMSVDASNRALYEGADEAQSLLGAPVSERIQMLERYPDRAALPPLLVQKLALALAEAGRAEEAETLVRQALLPARGKRHERAPGVPGGPLASRAGAGSFRSRRRRGCDPADARGGRARPGLHARRPVGLRRGRAGPAPDRRDLRRLRSRGGGARALGSAR